MKGEKKDYIAIDVAQLKRSNKIKYYALAFSVIYIYIYILDFSNKITPQKKLLCNCKPILA